MSPTLPPITFPESLPVSGKRDEIEAALARDMRVGIEADVGDRVAVAHQEWSEGLIRSWSNAGWFDLPMAVGDRIAPVIGAAFILTDPIFQGLAISMVFGLISSTALTILVIPAIYIVLRDRPA